MILISAFMGCFLTVPCFAAGNAFKEIYEDSLYGGLAGTLVGAAIMAFTKKPGDHLDYMIYGAAGGVLAGATYGLITTTRSLAEYENGKLRFAMPTIVPDFQEANSKGQTAFTLKAELLRGNF
jgi:hypothetical protein